MSESLGNPGSMRRWVRCPGRRPFLLATIWGIVIAHSFFSRVYQVVRQIPPGCVATYGQIARLLGEPHAARSVGWAMSASSDPRVPWHRVLNAQGRISAVERRAESGLQRALLEEEGVVFDDRGRVDLAEYRWNAPPDVADRLAPP